MSFFFLLLFFWFQSPESEEETCKIWVYWEAATFYKNQLAKNQQKAVKENKIKLLLFQYSSRLSLFHSVQVAKFQWLFNLREYFFTDQIFMIPRKIKKPSDLNASHVLRQHIAGLLPKIFIEVVLSFYDFELHCHFQNCQMNITVHVVCIRFLSSEIRSFWKSSSNLEKQNIHEVESFILRNSFVHRKLRNSQHF